MLRISVSRRHTAIVSTGLALALLLTACGGSAASAHRHQAEASASASATPTSPPNAYSSQVPTFGPAPKPQRVTLADNGPLAPIFKTVPTNQPVVFITMDDGQVQLPEMFQLLEAAKVPETAFLISPVAAKNPAFFRTLQDKYNVPIEAHTLTHPKMKGMPYEEQKRQICGSADQIKSLFGKRPTLFRPPYGLYDDNTLRAAHDCGMHAVFYWRESVTRGHVYYQTSEKKLHPGDIILMHFRKEFITDFIATLNEIKANGLTPALLEDYIS